MAIYAISKHVAALLIIVGVVSAQGYTSPEGSITTTTTDIAVTAITPVTTVTPITGVVSLVASTNSTGTLTETSGLPYTTAILFSCTPTTSAIGPFVTIYNTIYIDVCPTVGLTYVTYQITDTCGCQHASEYTRPTGCPSGFTTTEKTCTVCPGSPVITCTTPIAGQTTNPANPTVPISAGGQNSNPVPISAGGQGSNPTASLSVAPISAGSQNSNTQSNSSPVSASGSLPSYLTTNNAKPAAGSSSLGSIIVMFTAIVAGLMCIL